MALEDMAAACDDIDKAAFGRWNAGAVAPSTPAFASSTKTLKRLRTFRELMPNSRLQMLLRGQNLLGYRHYEDMVVDKFVEKSRKRHDVFRVFDATMIPNSERAMTAVKKVGGHAQGTICYTVSPYTMLMATLNWPDNSIWGQIPSLSTYGSLAETSATAYDIIRGVKDTYGDDVQINVHCHSTTGVTLVTLMKSYRSWRRCGRYRHLFCQCLAQVTTPRNPSWKC